MIELQQNPPLNISDVISSSASPNFLKVAVDELLTYKTPKKIFDYIEAENKKSIIVYADWIDKFEALDDAEAGRLIKHFFRYVNGQNPVAPDRITELTFIDIKKCLKRDLDKWKEIKEKRSFAGKISADKRQQKATNPTSVESVEKRATNPTVSVSVNDSVNVNDNVFLITENFLKPEATEPYQNPETGIDVVKWGLNKLNDEINSAYTAPTTIQASQLPEWFARFSKVYPTVSLLNLHKAFKDFCNTVLSTSKHIDVPKNKIELEIINHFVNKFNKANGK